MFHLNPSSDMEYDTLLATLLDIKMGSNLFWGKGAFHKNGFCSKIRSYPFSNEIRKPTSSGGGYVLAFEEGLRLQKKYVPVIPSKMGGG